MIAENDHYIQNVLRAVACRRGSLHNMTFDAEVAFNGKHYVIKTGLKDHDEAKAIAQKICDSWIKGIIIAVENGLKDFPIAKP